jgi:hypothetical protein
VRRHPDPLVADDRLLSVPRQSALYAAGATAFLAVVGRSRPGVFLKATAYLSAANISITACDAYGRRELNRAVFKLDNIDPKPGKLWERTKHWSVDDAIVGGGLLGTLLALSPRAFPGAHGWKRLFGAATVGCAVGGFVGNTRLAFTQSRLDSIVHLTDVLVQHSQYARLQQDETAKASLSRFGKLVLTLYTWPNLRLPTNNSNGGKSFQAGAMVAGAQAMPLQLTQQQMDRYTLMKVEFNNGELIGPDLEDGQRIYRDTITDRDTSVLQEWLERLEELRKTTASEAEYLWRHLAAKEDTFYQWTQDDAEKDLLRREIQLLNNLASDFALRDAIYGYHIADTLKRLRQIEHVYGGQNVTGSTPAPQAEPPIDWTNNFSPQLATDHVRTVWTRHRELLGFFEQHLTMRGKMPEPEAGTAAATQLAQLRENAENLKKNVEATERLLKELEDQMQRADKHVTK